MNDPEEFEGESRHAMATRKRARNGNTTILAAHAPNNHHHDSTTVKQVNGGLKQHHTASPISEIIPTNGSSAVNGVSNDTATKLP